MASNCIAVAFAVGRKRTSIKRKKKHAQHTYTHLHTYILTHTQNGRWNGSEKSSNNNKFERQLSVPSNLDTLFPHSLLLGPSFMLSLVMQPCSRCRKLTERSLQSFQLFVCLFVFSLHACGFYAGCCCCFSLMKIVCYEVSVRREQERDRESSEPPERAEQSKEWPDYTAGKKCWHASHCGRAVHNGW